jgi:hypothetical protein
MNLREMIQWQTISGPPQTFSDITIRPQSKALVVRWPNGGYVWNQPVAIVAEKDGISERIPINDVTRQAIWSFYGLAAVIFVLLALVRR